MLDMQGVPTYRWEQPVKHEAKAVDDASLGEIKQIGSGWVMTEGQRKGMTRFYLTKCLVKGFDGKVVRFDVTETDAEKNLMKPVPPGQDEYQILQDQAKVSRIRDVGASDLMRGKTMTLGASRETGTNPESACRFCGGKFDLGYHYACHACGDTYRFIHMSRHMRAHGPNSSRGKQSIPPNADQAAGPAGAIAPTP